MKKPVGGFAAVAATLVLVAAGGAASFNGTIESSDPTQTGRLTRTGTASSCVAVKANPGVGAPTGARHYDSYTFTNSTGSGECVTVTLTSTSGENLFTAAYLGSFDPSNPGTNYLADPAASGTPSVTYSFLVGAGQTFVVVVHEVDPNGCLNCTYTLDVNTALAVKLASARATSTKHGVLLRWRTGTEADLLGFRVYRSRGHSWRQVTRSLIAAKGSVSGASYRFLDRTAKRGVHYRYRIKAVDRDGTTHWFEPVRVT
jgi:hypothetical protein